MAKQNVTFVERHIEKIVAGVAGAVLLFMLVTNVLMSPHVAKVAGEALGPGSFYAKVADQAGDAQRRMQSASDVPQDFKAKSESLRKMLSSTAKPFPLDLRVAAVPLNPPMPDVAGGPVGPPVGAKVKLAEILPPTQPVLSIGKAAARLAVPRDEQPGVMTDASTEELTTTTDFHWVTGAGIVNRKGQRNKFAETKYLSDRQELIVAEIRVERREQLPNGLWGGAVVIQPYLTRRISAKDLVEVVQDGTEFALSDADGKYISDLRQLLENKDQQSRILRPPFQTFLTDTDPKEDDTAEWRIPTALKAADGTEVDMTLTDFGIQFFDEEGKSRPVGASGQGAMEGGMRGMGGMGGGRPAGKVGGARPIGGDAAAGGLAVSATKRVQDAVKKAHDLIGKKKWAEAKQVLEEIAGANDLTEQQKKPITDLLKTHRTDFEQAETLANRQQPTESTGRMGPDLDPFWFTDISVEPGKTYQYRTSAVAMNQYAGMAGRLENPRDAARLLIQGQWSEWSKATTVPPAKYLFLTAVPPDGGRVDVELCEWKSGTWEKAQNKLQPGDMATAAKGKIVLNYGAFLVSAEPLRPFARRSGSGKGDAFKYEAGTTGAAVLVNALGEIEEHFVAEDAERQRDVNRQITEEKRRRESLKLQGPTAAPVGRQPVPRPSAGREMERDRDRERPGGRGGERGRGAGR